jgi:hypothetical protein
LEIAAGAPKHPGRTNIWSTNVAIRAAERALAEQAELAYRNTVATGRPRNREGPRQHDREGGRERDTGHAFNRPSKGKAARQTTSP